MKPAISCYNSVQNDIMSHLQTYDANYIFFDDLVSNLQGAKNLRWKTVWISPEYKSYVNYPFIDLSLPQFKISLRQIINIYLKLQA